MTLHSVVIQKLLSTNAQLGRRVVAHHFKIYTYGLRNKMAIIDSDKTLICMRSACNFIAALARQKGRFMFINTNPLFDEIFEQMTKKIGTYSPSGNALWRTRGFLTNSYSPKKFRSRNKKIIFGPTQPPDCVIIVDTERKSSVIKEADKLQIPIVALVDSNMPLEFYKRIAYPIPANDSVKFVYLFCNLVTKTLLLEQTLDRTQDELSTVTNPEVEARKVKRIKAKKRRIDLAKGEITIVPYADLPSVSEGPEAQALLILINADMLLEIARNPDKRPVTVKFNKSELKGYYFQENEKDQTLLQKTAAGSAIKTTNLIPYETNILKGSMDLDDVECDD
ncbi:UTP--glucose-1-phosphate uridylyltransferase-like isoform X2 [Senna tora]|uniref:UTP--glucose-1-phosphate uridylyltransferase-like isoform X2 n=1 Tax=Senna tora TaxID=362788 RepID=A0A834SNA8_9FABA|nr:UTP--glucose-1-phosphate uridylyltransferase-like isoform X2 [Senna tora]